MIYNDFKITLKTINDNINESYQDINILDMILSYLDEIDLITQTHFENNIRNQTIELFEKQYELDTYPEIDIFNKYKTITQDIVQLTSLISTLKIQSEQSTIDLTAIKQSRDDVYTKLIYIYHVLYYVAHYHEKRKMSNLSVLVNQTFFEDENQRHKLNYITSFIKSSEQSVSYIIKDHCYITRPITEKTFLNFKEINFKSGLNTFNEEYNLLTFAHENIESNKELKNEYSVIDNIDFGIKSKYELQRTNFFVVNRKLEIKNSLMFKYDYKSNYYIPYLTTPMSIFKSLDGRYVLSNNGLQELNINEIFENTDYFYHNSTLLSGNTKKIIETSFGKIFLYFNMGIEIFFDGFSDNRYFKYIPDIQDIFYKDDKLYILTKKQYYSYDINYTFVDKGDYDSTDTYDKNDKCTFYSTIEKYARKDGKGNYADFYSSPYIDNKIVYLNENDTSGIFLALSEHHILTENGVLMNGSIFVPHPNIKYEYDCLNQYIIKEHGSDYYYTFKNTLIKNSTDILYIQNIIDFDFNLHNENVIHILTESYYIKTDYRAFNTFSSDSISDVYRNDSVLVASYHEPDGVFHTPYFYDYEVHRPEYTNYNNNIFYYYLDGHTYLYEFDSINTEIKKYVFANKPTSTANKFSIDNKLYDVTFQPIQSYTEGDEEIVTELEYRYDINLDNFLNTFSNKNIKVTSKNKCKILFKNMYNTIIQINDEIVSINGREYNIFYNEIRIQDHYMYIIRNGYISFIDLRKEINDTNRSLQVLFEKNKKEFSYTQTSEQQESVFEKELSTNVKLFLCKKYNDYDKVIPLKSEGEESQELIFNIRSFQYSISYNTSYGKINEQLMKKYIEDDVVHIDIVIDFLKEQDDIRLQTLIDNFTTITKAKRYDFDSFYVNDDIILYYNSEQKIKIFNHGSYGVQEIDSNVISVLNNKQFYLKNDGVYTLQGTPSTPQIYFPITETLILPKYVYHDELYDIILDYDKVLVYKNKILIENIQGIYSDACILNSDIYLIPYNKEYIYNYNKDFYISNSHNSNINYISMYPYFGVLFYIEDYKSIEDDFMNIKDTKIPLKSLSYNTNINIETHSDNIIDVVDNIIVYKDKIQTSNFTFNIESKVVIKDNHIFVLSEENIIVLDTDGNIIKSYNTTDLSSIPLIRKIYVDGNKITVLADKVFEIDYSNDNITVLEDEYYSVYKNGMKIRGYKKNFDIHIKEGYMYGINNQYTIEKYNEQGLKMIDKEIKTPTYTISPKTLYGDYNKILKPVIEENVDIRDSETVKELTDIKYTGEMIQ